MTEVPTLRLDHLTPEQTRAFMIADNRLSEISTFDDQLLAQQLKELSLHGLDFSVEVTGFEMGEIEGLTRCGQKVCIACKPPLAIGLLAQNGERISRSANGVAAGRSSHYFDAISDERPVAEHP